MAIIAWRFLVCICQKLLMILWKRVLAQEIWVPKRSMMMKLILGISLMVLFNARLLIVRERRVCMYTYIWQICFIYQCCCFCYYYYYFHVFVFLCVLGWVLIHNMLWFVYMGSVCLDHYISPFFFPVLQIRVLQSIYLFVNYDYYYFLSSKQEFTTLSFN